jgi:hypothetical protein
VLFGTYGGGIGLTSSHRKLLGIGTGLLAFLLLVVAPLGRAGEAAAAGCPNEAIREQQGSGYLPECRAYEQVSPVDKNGSSVYADIFSAVGTSAVSPDGQSLLYTSLTPFDEPKSGLPGNYVATRTPSGWESNNMTVDCGPFSSNTYLHETAGASSDLSTLLFSTLDRCNPAVPKSSSAGLYSEAADGTVSWISQVPAPRPGYQQREYEAFRLAGYDAGAGHVLFEAFERAEPPPSGEPEERGFLYDRTGGQTVPVGVDSSGAPLNNCGAQLGARSSNGGDRVPSTLNPVSEDGNVIFFKTGLIPSVAGCTVAEGGGQLYARIDNRVTVPLSASRRSPAEPKGEFPPSFLGATPGGSKAFFESSEQLTDDATPGGGMYEYDLSEVLSGNATEGTLRFLTPSSEPGGALVQKVMGMSPDGDRVYFVGSAGLATGSVSIPGQNNIYLDEAGKITWIGVGAGEIEIANDAFSVSQNGAHLAFLTEVKQPGIGYENKGFPEVYEYNAGTGKPAVCVSCNPSGTPATGPARLYGPFLSPYAPAGPREFFNPTMVSDSGQVFFESPEELTVEDLNSHSDVYEYHEGSLSLISSGSSTRDAVLYGISPDGTNVYFATVDSLVPQDIDHGDQDAYDARVDGGFLASPAALPPCGEAVPCKGAAAVEPTLNAPSASLNGAGNLRHKPRRHPNQCRNKHGKKRARCERQRHKKHQHRKKDQHRKPGKHSTAGTN